jgi:hypothetical protein
VLVTLAVIVGLALATLIALALVIVLRTLASLLRARFSDRSSTNDRTSLAREHELPRYLEPSSGKVDTSARWPGWDGWYFFMIPEDKNLPLKMVRTSIMTGLYGLEGIDNYEELLLRLSTFDAVEHLVLTPTEIKAPGGSERTNYLSHRYLPKRSDLDIKRDLLDVAVMGTKIARDQSSEAYGRIEGSWPNYRFDFLNPETEIKVSLQCTAKDIVWWADIPGVFTYFSAFGDFEGTITYGRGTRKESAQALMHHPETYPLKGRGCFEHGYARRPFDYDSAWFPIRAVGTLVPSFKAVRYHYELFIGDGGLHGGFMFARALGIDFRNQGGFYLDGDYRRITKVRIEYSKDDDEEVGSCRGTDSATFHRKWTVRATTDEGVLEYTGRREWPPAAVSANMIYYNFSYEGNYGGRRISGRGYGEYLGL